MQEGRPVHAHTNMDAIAFEAVTPGRIDHGGIGLQRLHDRGGGQAALFQQPADPPGGFVVEGNRRHQRFARMPQQGERPPEIGAVQHPLHGRLQHGKRDPGAITPIRQIAVVAIEVAEGGGLNHQQPHRAITRARLDNHVSTRSRHQRQ